MCIVQGIFEANVEASSVKATCDACGHALIHHQSVNPSNLYVSQFVITPIALSCSSHPPLPAE